MATVEEAVDNVESPKEKEVAHAFSPYRTLNRQNPPS
jgi:hypothetical protein